MDKNWLIESFSEEWYEALKPILVSPYFKKLGYGLANLRKSTIVHPSSKDMFKAFRLTPLSKVKVVFCGQDPYFSKDFADGLLFSNSYVMFGEDAAPSLVTLLKELSNTHPDWESRISHGRLDPLDLSRWAEQGVLLINSSFSVPEGYPGAHITHWSTFAKEVFKVLNKQKDLVFVFFGKEAQKCAKYITNPSHFTLSVVHPAAESYSPGAGFLGCNMFKIIDEELEFRNKSKIEW